MADNNTSQLLAQLEARVGELERMLKAPAKSKDSSRTDLLDTTQKITQDLRKIEAENEPIRTFFSKWSQVEPMISSLESGEAFLTPEVKLAILLACEENLSHTSSHLQSIQELEKFVNPPSLQTVPGLMGKLAPIETTQFDLKVAASRFGADVERHIQSYNSIKFVYWDHMLNLWETQIVGNQQK